jgi:nucleoside 2-deoxyribosyltransferase
MTTQAEFWDRHLVALESDTKRTLIPKLKEADAVVIVCPPDSGPDAKIAVEVGLAIFLNKPLIVLVPPDRYPAPKLRRAADEMLYVPDNPDLWPPMINKAVQRTVTLRRQKP